MKCPVIRSGGQTGVDRAALDAALAAGFEVTGWCPLGRLAEDGIIDPRYPLAETASADPAERTRRNVLDADGTLILTRTGLADGTALTARIARQNGTPIRIVDPRSQLAIAAVAEWVRARSIRDLNIAGPRESDDPGIYQAAFAFVHTLLAARLT